MGAGKKLYTARNQGTPIPAELLRAFDTGKTPPRQENLRPIGLAEGAGSVPASFFEPMPAEFLDAFYGTEGARPGPDAGGDDGAGAESVGE